MKKYQNFQILIASGDWTKWIDVCAVDISAAKSDIEQAYVGCKVIQWKAK